MATSIILVGILILSMIFIVAYLMDISNRAESIEKALAALTKIPESVDSIEELCLSTHDTLLEASRIKQMREKENPVSRLPVRQPQFRSIAQRRAEAEQKSAEEVNHRATVVANNRRAMEG